ncbi:MAG: microcystin-dependent protein [Gammaproteobacteria bacterium]|jgi:microcystin-dependent protein
MHGSRFLSTLGLSIFIATQAYAATDETESTGNNTPFNNLQPSLAINYFVQDEGVFPSRGEPSDSSGNELNLGFVRAFAGNFAPGRQLADGRTKPIQDDTALFSIYGAEFGGDGRTVFNLPDLRGNAPRGSSGDSAELGLKRGQNNTVLRSAQLYPHSHEIS